MWNTFNGFCGILVAIASFLFIWLLVWLSKRSEDGPFTFDAPGKPGSFEKLLQIYIDILKYVLGLASGSIILLIGSSSFRKSGYLPSAFASPLVLLTASIFFGLLVMLLLTMGYETYQHNTHPYTKIMYTRNIALGLSSLFCFCIGYAWLIFIVTI
ncbi:MAG: hypothetical protein FP814_11790 [Desulfobacterium sp.]|nr:hypothetical protein [Desulfobacteraceae bacterium]MBA3037161.1 hypothetical protein [Desulfobacterium sp.]MBU4036962.1 hypothetical protein [Pseudomonadota bacterium]